MNLIEVLKQSDSRLHNDTYWPLLLSSYFDNAILQTSIAQAKQTLMLFCFGII